MTPTDLQPTTDAQGSILSYRLDHAISNQGMGIALPELPQPGALTNAVLGEIERAWLFSFAMLALTFSLLQVRQAALLAVPFSAATAFAYGLLGDFSDLLFGFVGTAVVILIPFLLLLARLLTRVANGKAIKLLATQFLIVSIGYPCAAGLDYERQTLYLNLCAVGFLGFIAWVIVTRLWQRPTETTTPTTATQRA